MISIAKVIRYVMLLYVLPLEHLSLPMFLTNDAGVGESVDS